MKAVIMAGGKGSRVKSLSKELPKCLLKVGSKTVLQHQLEALNKEGINEIILSLGYMSNKIIDFVKSNKNFGMKIDFYVENNPLGTAGSLKFLPESGNDFLLIYGDIIFDIYINKFINFHYDKKGVATILVHPNDHPYDSDVVVSGKGYKVNDFIMKNSERGNVYNCVSSGLYILNSKIKDYIPDEPSDLVNDIFPKILNSDLSMYAYNSSEFVKDMGSPSRIEEVEASLKSGLISKRNLRKKQKAIFLDRDGVINKEVDHLICKSDFEFIPGSVDAIKKINKSEYLAIVITNQPAVAKGFCDISDIEEIHKYMDTLLGNDGAKLDYIVYCPCHPDKGFEGENIKYKRDCEFRKPNIGMIEKAKTKFNLDLSFCFFVGDSTRDIMTAKNANIKSYLVNTGYKGKDKTYDVTPDFNAKNLNDAVTKILKNDNI